MNVKIEPYLVCFLDLLGQKDKIKEFSRLLHAQNYAAIKEVADDVINGPVRFQELFSDGIKDFSEFDSGLITQVIGLETEKMEFLRENKVKYQRFSDSLFAHVRLPPQEEVTHAVFISQVLFSASRTFLKGLALGQPLRGGISYDWGAEISGSFYGGAVADSYDLENQVAQWPRIVVSEKVCTHLSAIMNNPDVTEKTKKFVHLSRGILKEDPVDKRWIVDYLSPVVLEMLKNENNLKEVKDAFDFVSRECRKMADQSNTKLAVRYKILLDYFEMNVGSIIPLI